MRQSGKIQVLIVLCIVIFLCAAAGCSGAGGSNGGNGGNGGGNGGSGTGTQKDSGSDENYQDVSTYISPDCAVVYHYYDRLSGNSEDGSIHLKGDMKNDPINGYQFSHGMVWSTSTSFVNHADPTVPMSGEHTCTINGVTTKSRYDGPAWVRGSLTYGLDPKSSYSTKYSVTEVNQGNMIGHVNTGEADKYVTGEECPYRNDPHAEARFYSGLVDECFMTDASDPTSWEIPITFEDDYTIRYSFIFDFDHVTKKDSTVILHVITAGETPVTLAPLVETPVTLAPLVETPVSLAPLVPAKGK